MVGVCHFINHLNVTRKWIQDYWLSTATMVTRPRHNVTLYVQCQSCSISSSCPMTYWGMWGKVGWGTALQAGRSWVQSPMMSLEFFMDIILPVTLWPWVNSASNRNEYQEYFLGVKEAGAQGWQPSCADGHDIWKPHPPGTLRTCPGISLPLPLHVTY